MDKNNFYVYALKRPDKFLDNEPQPFYIGKGQGNRMYEHLGLDGCNPYKDNIIRKLMRLELEIICEKLIENLTEEEAFEKEIELITFYGKYNNGGLLANLTDGGNGISGMVHSEKTKQKMSKSHKGKKHYFYGKHHSKETKQKIRESQEGKNHTKETKQKMSEAQLGEKNHNYGKHLSDECKRKISKAKKGKNNPMFGKCHTDEAKQKMSESLKKHYLAKKLQNETDINNNNTIDINLEILIKEKMII